MATIYSNRNDNTSSHTVVNPNVGTTWAGGLVPATTDQVYIVGRRTTINQAAFVKWAGTRTITVASTTNFATTGFFYTVTDRGQIVKITYTGTTATTFTGCAVDETDSYYAWTDALGVIGNTYYVHNPAYIVTINSGETFECNELIIQEAGWIDVKPGGTLKVNQGIIVRDGRMTASGNATITISRSSAALTVFGYLNSENYQISIIDLDGGETRAYSTLTSNIALGDGSVTVDTVTNGSFAVGDEVAIYNTNDIRRNNSNNQAVYWGYSANFKNMDEGFDVCGVNGSTIYLGLVNGPRGTVKSVETSGGNKILNVAPDNTYFATGDKIVVNNNVYTITSVEDSEHELYNYDFSNPSTSLSDFWVNDATHIYSAGWAIVSGVGIKNTTGAYRELVHKYLWARDIIVEADMSPLDSYTTGTRGTANHGLVTAYDPVFRWGHRAYDSLKSNYLEIGDDTLNFLIRGMANYGPNRPSRDTALQTAIRQPCNYKIDTRKGRTQVLINGSEYTTEFMRNGNFKGLAGIYTNGNVNFVCRNLKFKIPTQKITIATGNTISANDRVFQTGAENLHYVGDRILKIGSTTTGLGNHHDLAFAYLGQNGSGEWPFVRGINANSSVLATANVLTNHDMNADYYIDAGVGPTARYVVLDLGSQKTFTHVSFVPRNIDVGTGNTYGYNGIAVYGSNDASTWTTLSSPTNDTKKWYFANYNRIAFYATGTASYRYVKFESTGMSTTPFYNRWVNVGVHNFSDGYKISVNNASDFAIGDKITVMPDSGYSFCSREIEGYYAMIAGTDLETTYHGGWLMECTITNKVGDMLYLDKPIFWGYVEDEGYVTVMKSNRNLVLQGTIGPTTNTNDWRWPTINMAAGASLGRIYQFKNVLFKYVGSFRYTGSSTVNRGILMNSQDYWNHQNVDGCVGIIGPDGANVGWTSNNGISIFRNNLIMCQSIGIYFYNGAASYSGSAALNNKILACGSGIQQSTNWPKSAILNYNQVAVCDTGIYCDPPRWDMSTVPYSIEINRNFVKGASNYGMYLGWITGARRSSRIKMENNKLRACDDYSIQSYTNAESPYVGLDALAEHTGSRLSRFANLGFTAWNVSTATANMANFAGYIENYGRYGYNLCQSVYHYFERDSSRLDVTRMYSVNGDGYASLGIELDILDDVPFEVLVQFDYKLPQQARIQNGGTADGRLFIRNIQAGAVLSTQYGAVPASAGTGWNTFSYQFNNFAAAEGRAAVYLNRAAQNNYVDFRNGRATVFTDYPDKIRVIGNTFNFANIWDPWRDNQDKALLTAPTRTINISRVKF